MPFRKSHHLQPLLLLGLKASGDVFSSFSMNLLEKKKIKEIVIDEVYAEKSVTNVTTWSQHQQRQGL